MYLFTLRNSIPSRNEGTRSHLSRLDGNTADGGKHFNFLDYKPKKKKKKKKNKKKKGGELV
jgi:hypothetical protein